MRKLIETYVEENIQKDFKWKFIIYSFSLYGIITLFNLARNGIYVLNSTLIIKILTVITTGFIFGILLSLPMCYLIKFTSKIYKVEITAKKIANVLTMAYKPHIISVLIVVIFIVLNHILSTNLIQGNIFLTAITVIILNGILGFVGILSLVIEFYGLMRILNLTFWKTILCFVLASLCLSPIWVIMWKY